MQKKQMKKTSKQIKTKTMVGNNISNKEMIFGTKEFMQGILIGLLLGFLAAYILLV